MSATNYLSFINSQIAGGDQAAPKPELIRRAVTLSRQTGSGAQVIAQMLAARLQEHHRDNTGPWTVFDRNLMEKVLEEHQLPTYLASSFPEDRISAMEDTLHDIFGLHPPQETIVRQTAETIMGLAELGNAILIGRGAASSRPKCRGCCTSAWSRRWNCASRGSAKAAALRRIKPGPSAWRRTRAGNVM
jgi:hypothetical protein